MLTESQEYCFRIGMLRRKIEKLFKFNEQIDSRKNKEIADRYEELGELLDKYIIHSHHYGKNIRDKVGRT